jgi:hypothetical protein
MPKRKELLQMKKFISAASAMTMVASLVGSAIPFTTVAAEASKGLELRAFVDKDNKAVSTTISAADIAAGDVTIPVGIYLLEKENDTKSVRASFGISTKDGDCSGVTFGGADCIPYIPNAAYFNDKVTVSAGGKDYSTKNLPCFSGKMSSTRNGDIFQPTGTYTCSLDTKQNSQKWDNAWGSLVWAQPVQGGYQWTGDTSDAFPGFVFDCTFPKGTPAGTYTIEFVNMVPDEKYPKVWSTMLESDEPGLTYTVKNGNLTCKSLTITIEGKGGETPQDTTTTKPATTTTKPAATTTTPSQGGETQADFIVKGSKVEYKAGEDNYMDFFVESNGHKGAMIVFEMSALPAGVTAEIDPMCMSFAHNPQWSLMNKTYNLDCMDPTTKDPLAFDDSNYVVSFKLTADSSVKDGVYKIGFDRFHVVEQPHEKFGPIVEFDATVVPGELVIGTPTTTTAPVATKPGGDTTTTPSQGGETQADFIVKGSEVKYDATKDNYMDFFVESNGHKGAMIVFEMGALPAGVTAEIDPMCMSFAHNPQWSLMNKTYNLDCMDPTSKDPLAFDDSQYVVSFKLTVADTVKDGVYEIGFDRFHVVEQPHEKFGPIVEFNATVVPGKLIVGDPTPGEPGTTTTTTKPSGGTTTTAPVTTTPTTKAVYGDTNCDGKVNIADVVVLNKWLNDNSSYNLTAQGKINADCCDAKAGTPDENDSKAIIQSLVSLVKIADGTCKSTDLK